MCGVEPGREETLLGEDCPGGQAIRYSIKTNRERIPHPAAFRILRKRIWSGDSRCAERRRNDQEEWEKMNGDIGDRGLLIEKCLSTKATKGHSGKVEEERG